jgi:hypothetical protein
MTGSRAAGADRGDQRAQVGAHPADDAAVAEQAVEETFIGVVDEGRRRLSRPWVALLATGAVGGIDVGTGVLAMLLVVHATGSMLLGALAFPIGFIAVTLARSELFTEDFLIPVSAVIVPHRVAGERANPAPGVALDEPSPRHHGEKETPQ